VRASEDGGQAREGGEEEGAGEAGVCDVEGLGNGVNGGKRVQKGRNYRMLLNVIKKCFKTHIPLAQMSSYIPQTRSRVSSSIIKIEFHSPSLIGMMYHP
jgi:hypothetical protein